MDDCNELRAWFRAQAGADAPDHPIEDIIRIGCDELGVNRAELLSDARYYEIVRARRIIAAAARAQGHSVSAIARGLKRDHTTICHALARFRREAGLVSDGRGVPL